MRFISVLLIAFLCVGSPATLYAAPSEQDIEKARGHFATGAEFYALGDFSKAIVEFLQGHNLAPNAMFLYNISLSYQRLENLPEARNAAVKARGFDGMPQEVSVRNEARISSFDVVLRARDLSESVNEVDAPADAMVTGATTSEAPSNFGALGWTGAALTAIGAASLVFALVLNSQVEADLATIDEARARNDFDEANRLTDEVNSTRTTGLIFLFSGIGFAAVGLSMVAWDLLDDDSAQGSVDLTIAPTDTADGAVIGLGGRF